MESEYRGMSYALMETIPIIKLLKEINMSGFIKETNLTKVAYKFFKYNSGELKMVTFHKHRSSTKHPNVKTNHFRDYVTHGEVNITPIGTLVQVSD